MSKVTITMTLDVPEIEEYSDAEIRQMLSDNVINFMENEHQMSALNWLAEAKGDETSQEHLIYIYHKMWAKIMKKCTWTFKTEV